MKRCHRFINTQHQPYVRFDFQNSLRKYEKMPAKKLKRDTTPSRHILPQIQAGVETAKQQSNSQQELPSFPQSTTEVVQCKESPPSPLKKEEIQKQASLQFQGKMKEVEDEEGHKEKEAIKSTDSLQQASQAPTAHARSSGRLHLNSSVFISARSLQRLCRLGSEELVIQELLKQRQYLSQQMGEVAQRVREYMGEL